MRWRFYIEYPDSTQELIDDPKGWDTAVFNFKRDKEWHGIFFEYAATLQFYKKGFQLIRDEYDANGIESSLVLIIQVACDDDDDFEEFYRSRLNFTRIKFDESENCLVELEIEDDTCLSQFINRQDQEIDLASLVALDGEALAPYTNCPVDIELKAKTIVKTDAASFDDDNGDSITSGTHTFVPVIGSIPDEITDTMFHWVGFPQFDQELNPEVVGYNKTFVNGSNIVQSAADFMWEPSSYFLGMTYNFDVQVTVLVDVWVDIDATVNEANCTPQNGGFDTLTVVSKLRRFNINTLAFTDVILDTSTFNDCFLNSPSTGGTVWGIPTEVPITISYTGIPFATIASDEQILLVFEVTWSGDYDGFPGSPFNVFTKQQVTMLHESTFKVYAETLYPPTFAAVSLVNEAFARIVESITGNCMTVYSDYFGRTDSEPYNAYADGCGSLECTTSGLLLRRITGATQTVSYKQLYEALNAVHNLGFGLELDTVKADGSFWVRIEPSKYFYDDTVILTCDRVPKLTRTVITDEHFSISEFGYTKWEIEAYNGLDEFNTKHKYRTSLTTVKNTISKLCQFIASGYAIEITRQQHILSTKDWKYDNDNFIICLMRGYDVAFEVEQGNILSPANLIDPDTVYNFRISPNRNALRWLNKTLGSYPNPLASDGLIFMSGEGNILAEGQLDDGCNVEATVLSESEESLKIPDLEDTTEGFPVYRPELWEFDFPMSIVDYRAVKANPRGIIEVRYGQHTDFHECYIREIQYKPNEGIASFQLLPKLDPADLLGDDFDGLDFEEDFLTN